jgi:hypothetical protein
MDTEDFNTWLSTAAIGDKLVYYSGFLGRDRADEINTHTKQLTRPAVAGLHDLAKAVLSAAAARKVMLVQRRLGNEQYEYQAIRWPVMTLRIDHQPLTKLEAFGIERRQALAAE